MSLDGKTAVVTGGGSGIGLAIARRLLRDGARVMIGSRDRSKLERVARELDPSEARVAHHACDVGSREGARGLIAAAVERFGGVDILVNAAGVYLEGTVLDMSDAVWDETMATDLKAPFLCAQEAARDMVRRQVKGRIINISSINGLAAEPGYAAYNAAKAGLIGLTRAMAVDLAPHGITANAIAPGWIMTPMSEALFTPEVLANMGRVNLAGRVGEADEIAQAAAFLADEATTFITGATLVVDGGQTAVLPLP